MKRFWLVLIGTFAATAAAAFLDQWVFDHVVVDQIYHYDWAKCLKLLGTMYPWLVVALVIFLLENERPSIPIRPLPLWCYALQKALLLLLATLFAGAAVAAVKIVVHRPRPDYADTHNGLVSSLREVLQSRTDLLNPATWTNARVFEGADSFPSGHTTVVFAAAFALTRLYPRGKGVWYALAAGCALTRLLDRAHHASDVVFAAGIGCAGAWAAWRLVDAVGWRIERRFGKQQGLYFHRP